MATTEKDVEHARHLEIVSKHGESGDSLHGEKEDLKTLDAPDVRAEDVVLELPANEQKRILRKVDWRIVPLLTFLYLVAFIDRSNSEFITQA